MEEEFEAERKREEQREAERLAEKQRIQEEQLKERQEKVHPAAFNKRQHLIVDSI